MFELLIVFEDNTSTTLKFDRRDDLGVMIQLIEKKNWKYILSGPLGVISYAG